MTANDLLTRVFIDIGINPPGETVEADDAAIGLGDLQNFVDSLGAKAATMFAHARNVLPLTNGQQNYTIGIGGTLNIARPQWIDEATCLQTSTGGTILETPVHILTEGEFAAINVKAITTAIVTAIYYDYAWAAGLGNLFVYPYPNVAGLSLVLYVPVAVQNFADLVSDYTFPPGYAELLEYNVAKRLSIKYPKAQVSPLLMKMADDTLRAVLTSNFRPEVLAMDPALIRRRNIGSTYWGIIGDLG